jgi:uncharacterized protein
MDKRYADKEAGGYYSVHTGMAHSVMRIKEDYDGAEPSPNSLSAYNLARLAALTHSTELQQAARRICTLFHTTLKDHAEAVPYMVMALSFLEKGQQQIVLAGDPHSADFKTLLATAQQLFLPHAVLLHAGSHSHLSTMVAKEGVVTAYVCQNYSCKAPITDPAALQQMLLSKD